MTFRRRLLILVATTMLGTGIGVSTSSPASAQHYCGTDICYPDSCINIQHKPYTIFC